MEWLHTLFFGNGIAHAVLTFALVITIGILLGKVKIGGVSLGITWILFVGIVLSHFGMTVDGEVRHFVQEFGLILFVFSIGLQVGPGFFASFKHGGMTLVMCAVAIVLLGVATAYVVHLVTGTPIPTMVGILSGAVTNTPGLGAAQQAYADASGIEDPTIALGYAVAYPLGVVGIIFTMIFIRYALRVKFEKEDEGLAALSREHKLAGIWMTRRHGHFCATLVNFLNAVNIVEIKFRVYALSPHIECKSNNVNIARSFAVAEKCALDSVCTCKQAEFCCGNARASVIMRMKRNNCGISVWQMTAEIFDLVCVAVWR